MIRFEGVSKSYRLLGGGRRRIFQNLSLALPPRNIAVLGRNGAGKSTFLRMVSGVVDPDRGRIYRNVRVSWPLGFRGFFHGQLTGIENIRFVARLYGVPESDLVHRVADFAEIGPFLNQPVRTYSSGMTARLAFGLSLAIRFDTYVVDELMGVGDANFREKSARAFDSLRRTSRIVMASHSMRAIRDYCDCGLVLHDGQADYFDDLEEAIDTYHRLNGLDPAAPTNRSIYDSDE